MYCPSQYCGHVLTPEERNKIIEGITKEVKPIKMNKIVPEEEIKENNSLCDKCRKITPINNLKLFECGHSFHTKCMVASISMQTGEKMLLTPREQLEYKLTCPAPNCGSDISRMINLSEYVTVEMLRLYLAQCESRIENDQYLEMMGIYIYIYIFKGIFRDYYIVSNL